MESNAQQMSSAQALQTVAVVVREFKGTFAEHQTLDLALQTLLKLVQAEEPKGEVQ